ncbi:hypothetical protein HZC20_01185 [Candidatus Peregrinibacteria bacterium]|nr:hypothetical protein [Candidatus Peregrinibacteria bacterium]
MENIVETKKCGNCGNDFPITDIDVNFYKEMNVPPPNYCPDCRQMRRLSWRNERTLYKRKCDATGKDIVSVFSSKKSLTVYDNSDVSDFDMPNIAYSIKNIQKKNMKI